LKVIDLPTALKSLAGSPPAPPKLPSPKADDLAVLMYTSGTSALPKGVMLTYANLQSDVQAAIQHARLQGTHRFLGVLPLFHSTGMLATLLAPVQLGALVVYIARFSPVATLNAIREHQISIIAAVPSMYAAIVRLKDAKPEDFKSLYATISGGEPLPAAVQEAFQHKFGIPIYEGYGLTETIGPIAFNVPGAIEIGSVGRLIPGAEAKITDDNGNAVEKGQTGEIWLRGPMVMKGYYNLPQATAEAITPDGFFKSGDLGHIDPGDYLHVTGRKKELIIVAGEKAVPREIEDVLMKHPAIADAAVVGKKDPMRGEVVVAFVILKEGQAATPDQLRDFCRTQNLAQWKCPREVTIVADLPRSPTGKVLKRVLGEQANKPA
jgi:long-chain acyl-CoA synthetase